MSGECDKCWEHSVDCQGVGCDIYQIDIKVYIEISELEKLNTYADFYPVYQYSKYDTPDPGELGKIDILSGAHFKILSKKDNITFIGDTYDWFNF